MMIAESIEKPRKGMRLTTAILLGLFLGGLLAAGAARAQGSGQDSSSSSSKEKKTPAETQAPPQPAPPPAPDGSDPISRRINNTAPALHDVEVGLYYMKKEKWDAAIDRFRDATVLLPDYALPYKLMGEAYEKKKFLPEALQAYQKYLGFIISEKEADDVRKRVSRLQGAIQEEEKRRAAATKP
jgi:tetratricopeptide (TPR) repeat protein